MLRITILVLCVAACFAGKSHHTTKSTTTTRLPDPTAPVDASAFCYACRTRRNQKDLYADPINCHNYYQCFYFNSTFAVGYQRRCAAGLFWHDEVLSCLPEGAVACQDQCRDPAVAGVGLYAGASCRQYFVCANTASYGMCCPSGTRYNAATYLCDEDPTCTAPCSQAAPAVQTTVAPARQFNASVCIDSFGAYLTAAAGESNAFYTIDIDTGAASDKQYCPAGVLFDLASCRCNVESESATLPTTTIRRQLTLYYPFTSNYQDESINHFASFVFDGAQFVANDGANAGSGYLALGTAGGYLAIPGTKSIDFRTAGSWFIAFRCNGVCAAGSLVSNNKDSVSSEYTVQLHLTNSSNIVARLHFWAPVGTVTLSAPFSAQTSGWTHAGVTYDGNTARLYVNGVAVASQNVGGYLEIAHCLYCFGSDQQYGLFNGNLDSIAVAKFAFTGEEVVALRDGNTAAIRAWGFY